MTQLELEQSEKGHKLASVFGLHASIESGWKEPRYTLRGGYGTKTALGVYRTVEAIISEVNHA